MSVEPLARGALPAAPPPADEVEEQESTLPAPGAVPARGGCTQAQLRRFVKSRPYVPLHELRRRFGIDGGDDEVCRFDTEAGEVFVGLPEREGRMLGELIRHGEVGYELLLDPTCPMIVGVYPMRPVPRA